MADAESDGRPALAVLVSREGIEASGVSDDLVDRDDPITVPTIADDLLANGRRNEALDHIVRSFAVWARNR